MHCVNINSFYLSRKAKHHRRILMSDGHSLLHTAILSVPNLLVTRTAASQPTGLQGILQGGMKSRRSTTQRTRPPLPLHRAGGEFWAVNPEGGPELWPRLQASISAAHLLLWVCVHQILCTQRSLLFQNPSLSMQPLQWSPPQLEEECEHYCFRGHFYFRNQEVYIHMYPRYAWLTMQISDSEHLCAVECRVLL